MRMLYTIDDIGIFDITIVIVLTSQTGTKTVLQFKEDTIIPITDKHKHFITHIQNLLETKTQIGLEHIANAFERW